MLALFGNDHGVLDFLDGAEPGQAAHAELGAGEGVDGRHLQLHAAVRGGHDVLLADLAFESGRAVAAAEAIAFRTERGDDEIASQQRVGDVEQAHLEPLAAPHVTAETENAGLRQRALGTVGKPRADHREVHRLHFDVQLQVVDRA